MKNIKSLLVFGMALSLPLFLIDSVYATATDKAQTSRSGVVDMFEVLPEYLQVNSTAENRDFHIKRNERSIGSGTQYYFYFEGGSTTASLTTNGLLTIGGMSFGSSTFSFNNTLFNTFVGYQVGSNTTGNSNVGVGYQALYSNTVGNGNDADGYQALYFNVDGGGNNGHGYRSLYNNISGSNNTGDGYTALFANVASNNSGFGYAAGDGITNGGSNTVVGAFAGRDITTASNCIVVGAGVNAGSSTASNQLNIGNVITGDVVVRRVNMTNSVIITGSSTSSADTSFAVRDSIAGNIISGTNDKSVSVGGTLTAAAFVGSGAGITDANNLRLTVPGTTTGFGRPVSLMWVDNTGSATAMRTLNGTTTRKTLYSQTIPGGAMGTSGVLEITYLLYSTVNSNIPSQIWLLGNGTISNTTLSNGGTNANYQNMIICANRGSTTSQVVRDQATGYAYGAANAAIGTISINTGTDTILSLSMANSIATATTTLEMVNVKLLNP